MARNKEQATSGLPVSSPGAHIRYIVDFYCHELLLAIEIDGSSHESLKAKRYDQERQKRLEAHGVRFLRFHNIRMKEDIAKVVEEIKLWIVQDSK